MGHHIVAEKDGTRLFAPVTSRGEAVGVLELALETVPDEHAIAGYAQDEEFVTGQLVRIDLPSGTARIVNVGHPAPIRVRVRVRDGHAERVALMADLPFSASPSGAYRVQELELRAGDRVVFLTDGMLERNATAVDALSVLTTSRHLHPREAVQDLTRRIVEACGGQLRDDATILCLDWHGGAPRLRDASEGADR